MAAQMSDAVKKFLEKPNFAVLATRSSSSEVQLTPVWFMVAGGHILINTSKGRVKLRNMQRDPRVVLAIVDRENPYQYVQIHGKVTKLDAENGAKDIDTLAHRYTGKPYTYPGGDTPQNRFSIHIEPTRISGIGT